MRATVLASVIAGLAFSGPAIAGTADNDRSTFETIRGTWSGPGEIVAGKYKGTRFICNFTGSTPNGRIGMSLDGTCRVGMFTQRMSASVERRGSGYRGAFMDGAAGDGLDVIGGNVDQRKVVMAIHRKDLKGAMLAKLNSKDSMNVTVSVRVGNDLVPVIGMNLKRTDGTATGSVRPD